FDRAVEQYAEAEKRWRARGESTPDYVLRSWAYDLASLERFDDAVRKCEASIAASPDDADLYFNFGNVLSSSASHAEAIEQLDRAIRLERNDPYYHHNKAFSLFELGNYEEGWRAWDAARDRYEKSFREEPNGRIRAEREGAFGDILTEIFQDYAEAERH